MRASNRPLVGLAAIAALAFPALAIAKKPDHAGGKGKQEKAVSWNVKGDVTQVGEDSVTVAVKHANSHGRGLTEVTFDLSNARVVARDVNGDGERNLADVTVGDEAKVQARRPKGQAITEGEVFPAKKAIFKAPEPEETEDEVTETESESAL